MIQGGICHLIFFGGTRALACLYAHPLGSKSLSCLCSAKLGGGELEWGCLALEKESQQGELSSDKATSRSAIVSFRTFSLIVQGWYFKEVQQRHTEATPFSLPAH